MKVVQVGKNGMDFDTSSLIPEFIRTYKQLEVQSLSI